MIIDKVTQAFIDNPKLMDTNYISNPKLSKRFGVPIEDIKESKYKASKLNSALAAIEDVTFYDDKITETYQEPHITSKTENNIKIKSNRPLTPTEISELVGADGINTKVARVWNKSAKNGTEWDYSVDLRYNVQDFYNEGELKEKLKELFPNTIKPFEQGSSKNVAKTSMVIYISDDHIGMLLENGKYTKHTYQGRLKTVSESIISQFKGINELVIVSLGDQMNGWNEQTTRGGHIVKSSSNKEQFDDYVSSRKIFYDDIFSSNIANKYKIVEVNNSNHTGLGFSYMANEWLKLYVSQKFPFVEMNNSTDLITEINLATEHILFAIHGKDEKHQKSPLPVVIDSKTESYLTDYILEQGINPKKVNVSFIKADQHKYAETEAKSFRYVSIPSIADGSDWQTVNFGSSKAGVVIELFWLEMPEPMRQVIRFK